MSTTLADVKKLTITELTELPASELLPLQQAAQDAYSQAQATKLWVDGAIAVKYHERAERLRQELGKETGVIHFDDAGVRVTANVAKKPEWDQSQLAAIAKRMWQSGEDPGAFIEMRYHINERTYHAWSGTLKADFATARTIKHGKPTYVLSQGGIAQ